MKHLLILILLTACSPIDHTHEEKPTKPQEVVEYKFAWNNSDYDKWLIRELKASDLLNQKPKDAQEFNYSKAKDALEFWGKLMVQMSKLESDWNSDKKYQETFRDQQGKRIWSRGLFQLSIESSKGYPCKASTGEDLHNPELNIQCAVQIINKWVVNDQVISGRVNGKWLGGSRFWSVLRTPTKLDQIKAANK